MEGESGAIPGFMLGVFQIPLNDCEELYRSWVLTPSSRTSSLAPSRWAGAISSATRRPWSKSSKRKWALMVETSRNSKCPKLSFVTWHDSLHCLECGADDHTHTHPLMDDKVDSEEGRPSRSLKKVALLSTPLKAYVFREYNLQPTEPGVHSHYLGAMNTKCGRQSEPLPLPWDTTSIR
ncbi:calcium-independent phospholipase A2-gamma-like isoform X2 [Oncorhynchus masou masou]